MNNFKWVILVKNSDGNLRFVGSIKSRHIMVVLEEALLFESLEKAIEQIIIWNEVDSDDLNNLINFPYVVIPHPDSVINFVRDQLVEKHCDDIPF